MIWTVNIYTQCRKLENKTEKIWQWFSKFFVHDPNLKFHWPCNPNSTTTYSGSDLKTLYHECIVHYPSEGSGCAMCIHFLHVWYFNTVTLCSVTPFLSSYRHYSHYSIPKLWTLAHISSLVTAAKLMFWILNSISATRRTGQSPCTDIVGQWSNWFCVVINPYGQADFVCFIVCYFTLC